MSLGEYLEKNPEISATTDPDILKYARFLDLSGKRFLVDYGYENCRQMAADELNRQLMDSDTVQ